MNLSVCCYPQTVAALFGIKWTLQCSDLIIIVLLHHIHVKLFTNRFCMSQPLLALFEYE